MTHMPLKEEAPDASELAEQELLDQLLKEGLALNDAQSTSTDPSKICKLLEVLFQVCILKPASDSIGLPLSHVKLERAHLTLSILERQTINRPDLLLSSSIAPDGGSRPMYAWLITRIIIALSRYEDLPEAPELVPALCRSAVRLLTALGNDLSDHESTYMRGPQRVASVLRELRSYGRDNTSSLLGFSDLPSAPDSLSQQFALHIALQTPGPFTYDTELSAATILSGLGRKIPQLSNLRQARYAFVVAAAVRTVPARHVLSRACVAVVEMSDVANDDRWQAAVRDLIIAVQKYGDECLRRDVWWAIRLQAGSLQLDTPVSRQKISYLLDPILPHLSTKLIDSVLSTSTLQDWYEQTNGAEHAEIREKLKRHLGIAPTSSLKRKRRDDALHEKVLNMVREALPSEEMDLTLIDDLPGFLKASSPATSFHLLRTPGLLCTLSQCRDDHQPLSQDLANAWFKGWDSVQDELILMRGLGMLAMHSNPILVASSTWAKPVWRAWRLIKSPERMTRRAAGLLLSTVYRAIIASSATGTPSRASRQFLEKLSPIFQEPPSLQETAILLLGDMGRIANEKDIGEILEILLERLGSKSTQLRSVAYTQLTDIATYRGKQPYNLLSPYLDRISVQLAECLVPRPDVVAETMQFIGYTRQAFFTLEAARKNVVPTLVLRHNREALETLSGILGQRLGLLLIEEAANILAKLFLHPQCTTAALEFVVTLLNEQLSNSRNTSSTTVDKYVRLSIVPLLVTIAIELGDENESTKHVASRALTNVQRSVGTESGDLGSFLKPHMLGILASMTEQLMTPRTTADHKRKIIRSIGQLIELVGHSMASFSPQIIASLQSTLEVGDLRIETLKTWCVFITFLKFADVGPYIGPTIAALVAGWASFNADERNWTERIIKVIAGDASHLKDFQDDIVRFDHIEELASLSQSLLSYRQGWSTKVYLEKLIDRTDSKNLAVSTASMREVRDLLSNQYSDIVDLVRGDTFDPIVGKLIVTLLGAATRDGDCEELKDLTYECLGLLGALDPDRFKTVRDETSMTIMSNFTEQEESVTFAIHLIRDLLVGAFRSTNDTKHQKTLAFAIQELLKFSGFDSRLVGRGGSVALKTRQRWERLPKDVLETITPLLDAQFTQNPVKRPVFQHPIYPHMKTYREWLQAWTVDLIGRIMDADSSLPAGNPKTIFSVFMSEPKNQDVAVAHHLLPHLVLHVLLSGDADAREQIRKEIHNVLLDQVSPDVKSAPDKRMLSAQVIFNLMDHLSKWLRLARIDNDRQSHTRPVDRLLSGIDTELTANAALKSRAFARSLRNFEERIVYLRTAENRGNAEMQVYFESLHEIYAELDEPDGMEGVSAYVVSPTLDLQIREHESTGRWTAAQSCWEVRLQQSPEDPKLQVGLLKCLQNLGHYDTIRTHVRGVISNVEGSEMQKELVPFQVEAAWTIGDWNTVQQAANKNLSAMPPIAEVLLAIRNGSNISEAIVRARRRIGSTITAQEYSRAYDAILQLHMLREAEMIHVADRLIHGQSDSRRNAGAIARRQTDELIATLAERFDMALPSFRVQEEILNKRRAAFSLMETHRLRSEQGQAWIQSAKIARKSGYEQTAYSAALQAHETNAPFAFIQAAKLIHQHGDILKALRELEYPVVQLIKQSDHSGVIDVTGTGHHLPNEDDFRRHRSLAKAVLLEARWSHEADRFEQNDVIRRFKKATELGETLESPFFHLGRYYDTLAATTNNIEEIAAYNHFTCVNYHEALQRGVKYIYQTMPRLLTVWLDLGEKPEAKKLQGVAHNVALITKLMDKSRNRIMTYQFLTAFPQMVSRITHPNSDVRDVLVKLVYRVVRDYPAQSLWTIVGAMQSKRKDRRDVAEVVLKRAVTGPNSADLHSRIQDARKLSTVLLKLAEDKPEPKAREASIAARYAYVKAAFPSTMIMPLQDALTGVLPSQGSPLKAHQAFPDPLVAIIDINDRVDIMPSLQQPKKLVFKGSDGKRYTFLCKPHDDLRKDARLMDFNSMINRFLNSASESRRRHLYIRTYAVMPLNEECGLLEWVSNTNALKSILEKSYQRHGKRIYSTEIYNLLDGARKSDNPMQQVPNVFKNKVLPMYRPTVFHEWFLNMWPEPSAWLTSRTNYARTLAVMSMIGYVLGLGDRHGENILFDSLSGDTVHVDLNCLFDRAKTFEVPERVPFRLTQNMVDALGVTGVEGVFRKAAEITMEILRSNGDSLMSVLEAFVHDPLVEWTKSSRTKSEKDVRVAADKNLRPIQKKLRGVIGEIERSVPNHVEALIKEATSATNLGLMYVGWAPWL